MHKLQRNSQWQTQQVRQRKVSGSGRERVPRQQSQVTQQDSSKEQQWTEKGVGGGQQQGCTMQQCISGCVEGSGLETPVRLPGTLSHLHAPAGGPSDATLVPVTFELSKHCPFGQALAILGDAPALGEWDVTRALRLEVSVCWWGTLRAGGEGGGRVAGGLSAQQPIAAVPRHCTLSCACLACSWRRSGARGMCGTAVLSCPWTPQWRSSTSRWVIPGCLAA